MELHLPLKRILPQIRFEPRLPGRGDHVNAGEVRVLNKNMLRPTYVSAQSGQSLHM